jgi:arabinose-5-phosphate isomerase
MGMTAVVTPARGVVGIFTDGDLRRALEKGCRPARARRSRGDDAQSACIGPERLAAETAQMMEEYKISQILVVDKPAR